MIKLRQLLFEFQEIDPLQALNAKAITLYHGTTMGTAMLAKKGELGPIDMATQVRAFMKARGGDKRDIDYYIKKAEAHVKNESPNVLYLALTKDSAGSYAKKTGGVGGEFLRTVMFMSAHGNVSSHLFDPVVITVTLPLSMVFTHPNFKTPISDSLNKIINMKMDIHSNTTFQFRNKKELLQIIYDNITEVFVYDKIPSKYIQRIEKV